MKLALKHAPPKGFWKRAFHELTARVKELEARND
jgi:hypothetical protein